MQALVTLLCVAGQPQLRWTEPGRCGTNCLYVMLAADSAHTFTYDAVADAVGPTDGHGSTMEQLAAAARSLGVPVAVRRIRPEECAALPVPFILHLELADAGGAGHFVTVFEIRDSGRTPDMHFVDGGNGMLTGAGLNRLKPLMTGFALVRTDRPSRKPLMSFSQLAWLSLIGGLTAGIIGWWITTKAQGAQ